MAKDIKEITEKLEQGVKDLFESNDYKEYLSFMSKFYNYSANNCLLIWIQKPDATLVAGYQAWQKKFKRQVRKGEKGITILAPIPHKYTIKEIYPDGTVEEKEIRFTTFKAIKVFDLSQTDGEAIPSICKSLNGSVENYDAVLENLKNLAPVPVGFEDIAGGAQGYYSHVEKRIAIQEGMSEQQTIKTLIHEIAHSILHEKENGIEKDADRNTKEVQAESVAYVVCSCMGLDTSDYSFGYVAGWSKDREAKELLESTEAIRNTSIKIIEGLKVA